MTIRWRPHLLWLLPACLAAVVVALFAVLAAEDLEHRERTMEDEGRQVARFVAETVRLSFAQYDRLLESLAARAAAQRWTREPVHGLMEELAASRQLVPNVDSIGLVDAEGNILAHSSIPDPHGINVADRDYFKSLRGDPGQGLYLAAPVVGRASGAVAIGAARAIRDAEGRFAGLLLLRVDPARFEFLRDLPDIQDGSVVAIHRLDGINLFHIPAEGVIGRSFRDAPLFREHLPRSDVGTYRSPKGSFIDGVDRVFSYRAVEGLPLVVTFGNRIASVHEAWRAAWAVNGALLAAALAGFLVLGVALQRLASRAALREEEARRREVESAHVVAREMAGAAAKAEEASRLKSTFLATMSHELRTPLNAIIGFSDAMLGGHLGRLDDVARRYVADINMAGHHLLSLISDILDYSRIEAGGAELRPEDVDLAESLRIVTDMARVLATRGGIDLKLETIPAPPALRGDPQALRQILLNLISNAVKFTLPGGTVTVGCSVGPEGCTITVADTGIGITEEDRASLFEPFRQGKRRAVSGGGTGLGLSIVKGLLDAHDASIAIDSHPGQGTKVTVIFPPNLLCGPARTLLHSAD